MHASTRIALLGLLALPAATRAQDCPLPATIAADRPGNLTGPIVLAAGHLQAETGWSRSRAAGTQVDAVGTTLVRLGLGCGAELRLGFGGLTRTAAVGAAAASATYAPADAWMGTKLRVLRGAATRPHVALILGSLIPTHSAVSHARPEPEAALSAAWELPHGQALVAYGGLAGRWVADHAIGEQLRGASWAFAIGPVGSFLEYSEFARADATARYVGTGLTVLPRASVQLDASLLVPLPRAGADPILGLGLSRRW